MTFGAISSVKACVDGLKLFPGEGKQFLYGSISEGCLIVLNGALVKLKSDMRKGTFEPGGEAIQNWGAGTCGPKFRVINSHQSPVLGSPFNSYPRYSGTFV